MDILAIISVIISVILFCIAVWLGWNLKSSEQIRSLYASLVSLSMPNLLMEGGTSLSDDKVGETLPPKKEKISRPIDRLSFREGILSPDELRSRPGIPLEKEIVFTGEIKLPSRVYEDDTHIVKINITPNPQIKSRTLSGFSYEPKSGAISLKVNAKGRKQSMKLKISLVGVGCDVEAFQPEVQDLSSECLKPKCLNYKWSCSFPRSGNKMLIVKLRAYLKSGEKLSDSSFQIDHKVKVAVVDNLTRRQVWVLRRLTGGAAVIIATVTSIIATVVSLHKLGVL